MRRTGGDGLSELRVVGPFGFSGVCTPESRCALAPVSGCGFAYATLELCLVTIAESDSVKKSAWPSPLRRQARQSLQACLERRQRHRSRRSVNRRLQRRWFNHWLNRRLNRRCLSIRPTIKSHGYAPYAMQPRFGQYAFGIGPPL